MVPEFLIDKILPSREVHLLAGPSGAGKTRWLMHMLKNEWEKEIPILGHWSYPVPWCYVAADRSIESVKRTFWDIDINPSTIDIIPAWGNDRKTLPQISDEIQKRQAKLAVIEGFTGFPDGVNPGSVRAFLCSVQSWCDQDELTIIGVAESPKMKPQERYENPRQRISGCAAWAHYTETVMLLEPKDVRHPKLPERNLYICPRNAKSMEVGGNFDDTGKLIFTLAGVKTDEELMDGPQPSPFKKVN
jgi:hypothetical protein